MTEWALLYRQTERAPQALTGFLRLALGTLYGLEVREARTAQEASAAVRGQEGALRAVCVVQDEAVSRKGALQSLSLQGKVPLLLLMPKDLAAAHAALSAGLPNVTVCDWSQVLGEEPPRPLQAILDEALAPFHVERLRVGTGDVDAAKLEATTARRLARLHALPALPELIVRIGRLLRDPATTAQDLEPVLLHEPAIVERLVAVVNSPAFAGIRGGQAWTLKDAIVRLGFRQLGAIAQQVKLMTALVRPQDSDFDLRRFWLHSVATATIAHRLVEEGRLKLAYPVRYDIYWTAALLHDVGKLLLGFLAWDTYAEVVKHMQERGCTFQRAEERLGNAVTHEYLGRLMLLKSSAPPELVEAVGSHDSIGAHPKPLVCLVHIADSLSRSMGLACPEGEVPHVSPAVLRDMGLSKDGLTRIQGEIEAPVRGLVDDLVQACLDP